MNLITNVKYRGSGIGYLYVGDDGFLRYQKDSTDGFLYAYCMAIWLRPFSWIGFR